MSMMHLYTGGGLADIPPAEITQARLDRLGLSQIEVARRMFAKTCLGPEFDNRSLTTLNVCRTAVAKFCHGGPGYYVDAWKVQLLQEVLGEAEDARGIPHVHYVS